MVDFYSVLQRAVRELPEPTAEARRNVFDRAAAALRKKEGISEQDRQIYLQALHDAFAKLQNQFDGVRYFDIGEELDP
jgi:hypothetical protein